MYNYSLLPHGHLIETDNTGNVTFQIRLNNASFKYTGPNSDYNNTHFYMEVESGGRCSVYFTREAVDGHGFRVFVKDGNPLLSS